MQYYKWVVGNAEEGGGGLMLEHKKVRRKIDYSNLL